VWNEEHERYVTPSILQIGGPLVSNLRTIARLSPSNDERQALTGKRRPGAKAGTRRRAEGTVLVDRARFLLEGIIEEFMPVLPQEDEELGTLDQTHDRLLGRRGIDQGMQRRSYVWWRSFHVPDGPPQVQIPPRPSNHL